MTDTTTIAHGQAPGTGTTYNPIAGTSFPPGTPVRQDLNNDDTVLPGRADATETTFVTGIAVGAGTDSSAQHSNRVFVQYGGPLTLTVDEWSAITGSPTGLVRGVPYFLSASESGKLTTKAPTDVGTFVAPVGLALSETDLLILLGFPSSNGDSE
jgi:hypothetical protein